MPKISSRLKKKKRKKSIAAVILNSHLLYKRFFSSLTFKSGDHSLIEGVSDKCLFFLETAIAYLKSNFSKAFNVFLAVI